MDYFVKDNFGKGHEITADDYEVDDVGDLVMLAEDEEGELAEIGRFPHYVAVVQLRDEEEEDNGEDE